MEELHEAAEHQGRGQQGQQGEHRSAVDRHLRELSGDSASFVESLKHVGRPDLNGVGAREGNPAEDAVGDGPDGGEGQQVGEEGGGGAVGRAQEQVVGPGRQGGGGGQGVGRG